MGSVVSAIMRICSGDLEEIGEDMGGQSTGGATGGVRQCDKRAELELS